MLRKCIWGGLLIGAAALFAAGFGTGEDPAVFMPGNTREVVRLHVVANSDAQFDQLVKLKVRDAILAYMAPKLRNAANAEQAFAIIADSRLEMEEVARKVLLMSGVAYPVQVQFGQYDFPVRTYGNAVYPAGKYNAVRIMLGKGEGGNWWCVLFPPLCFIDAEKAVVAKTVDIRSEGSADRQKKVEFRLKLAEILHSVN